MNDKRLAVLRHRYDTKRPITFAACGEMLNEIDSLQAELDERTKAGRYITCVLGGAGDDSEDGWDHDHIRSMFDHVCLQWPWCDPRNPADNPEGLDKLE